ncbi:MAG TPA: hypothetical protein VK125_05110 [Bacillota bacterium]|nr:hypothetical protein [Bacillota bacterium]
MMAEKLKNQSALSVFGSILFVLGTLGFMVGSGFVLVLSSISIGLASGTTLSLCMMFFSLRTKDGRQAAEVSGMAQSVGYLLAALGPWLFGLLFDVSGDMFFSLTMLLICSIIMIFVGFFSGLNRFVSV